jgi:hypothetical protein
MTNESQGAAGSVGRRRHKLDIGLLGPGCIGGPGCVGRYGRDGRRRAAFYGNGRAGNTWCDCG